MKFTQNEKVFVLSLKYSGEHRDVYNVYFTKYSPWYHASKPEIIIEELVVSEVHKNVIDVYTKRPSEQNGYKLTNGVGDTWLVNFPDYDPTEPVTCFNLDLGEGELDYATIVETKHVTATRLKSYLTGLNHGIQRRLSNTDVSEDKEEGHCAHTELLQAHYYDVCAALKSKFGYVASIESLNGMSSFTHIVLKTVEEFENERDFSSVIDASS
jgi:hypothetical protein